MEESAAACIHGAQWDQSIGEELANSVSHGLGLVCALIGTPILLQSASRGGDRFFFFGTIVFASAMLLVYFGSTVYHAWPRGAMKSVLQVIDHCAIFILIAGTYTPFTLGPLRGIWGWSILALIWALALVGVILKNSRRINPYSRLSLALYLGMGWLVLIALRPLLASLPAAGLTWLVGGGLAYTSGIFFFLQRRRRYSHFIWHLFVLIGTGCHYFAILACVSL